MKKRILSTILLWGFLFITLGCFKTIGCLILLILSSALTQYEFYKLLKYSQYEPITFLGIFFGFFLQISCALTNWSISECLAIIVIISTLIASLKHSVKFIQYSLVPTLIGIIYIPFMLSFLIKFVKDCNQFNLFSSIATIFWLIAISKFSDVGGLLIGCKFGKHKLAPNFSPNKTLEGLLGSICTSVIIGISSFLLFQNYLISGLTIFNVFLLSTILSIIALLGDIIESIIKRLANMKDSGCIIPGIGGIFDLTDSLIFSLPLGVIILQHVIL